MSEAEKIIEDIAVPSTSATPILDRVDIPADMKALSDEELAQLADEIRSDMIASVAKTGGHLGAGLGVVELTTAIHAVFDTPQDKLIWDVGHQCYPHKILTGRRDQMHTMRKGGGLSGFTKRAESQYDPFGAGHSSTSISAALGIAVARDLSKDNNTNVIAVIGDGAMSAGMAYEAMNNAGAHKNRLIVILNDNDMSISPPVGALNRHLNRLVSSRPYIGAREIGKKVTDILPPPLRHAAKRIEESARMHGGAGSLFEEMGFYYIGPINGHSMEDLLPILRNARDSNFDAPILIHAITQKGHGYAPAESSADKMHGVKKFDVITGAQSKSSSTIPSYTSIYADALIDAAKKDDKIVAITAAMDTGTGLDKFAAQFPERIFDVGIAEQHAVTFAAGLATEGYKPFVTIYSTFMQRAYDQLIHDVAIQNLPVRFMMDRAGLVGADGSTHAGSFDIAYLACIPNMTLMAAADEAELTNMVATAAAHDDGPIALRYPRGEATGEIDISSTAEILEIGKGRIMRQGNAKIAILSYGTRLDEAMKAAEKLDASVADARFAKPLDTALIRDLAANNKIIITIEEGSGGGFGAQVLEFMANNDLLNNVKVRTMTLPDNYQNQNDPAKQYEEAKLTAKHIVALAKKL